MSYEEVIDALSDAVAAQKHTQVIPPPTCPLIDKVIGAIEKAQKIADRKNTNDDEETLRESLSDIAWELYGLKDEMEAIRTHNDTLRKLGKEWHDIATEALRTAGVRYA